MNILQLFPTSLGMFQYEAFSEAVEIYRADIGEAIQEHALNSGRTTSQTDHLLHHRPVLRPLIDFFMDSVMAYLIAEKSSAGLRLRMQSCWATAMGRSVGLDMHQHPNSHFSGAFYLEVERNCQPIIFRDPRPQNRMFDFGTVEREIGSNYYSIQPHPGMLLVFPSWLEHKVGRNNSDQLRVSLSFNITVHGTIGRPDKYSNAIL